MSVVILDRQHVGKPGRLGDAGAWADVDRDGALELCEQEARLTPYYLLAAEEELVAGGIDAIPMSDGYYTDRHKRACTYLADVYLAGHLNAGGGRGGLVLFDQRSQAGPRLARAVAEALQAACPELAEVRAIACYDDRHHRDPVTGRWLDKDGNPSWLFNAFSCLAGVYIGSPTGIVVEPCFVDQPAHRPLLELEGLRRMGRAIGSGILTYLRS